MSCNFYYAAVMCPIEVMIKQEKILGEKDKTAVLILAFLAFDI